MIDRTVLVVEEVDAILAEAAARAGGGPHFQILHQVHEPGAEGCLPGELIAAVWLVHHGRRYQLRLTTATLILFDYFARRRFGQTATQIEIGIRREPFYARHGAAARTSKPLTRRISHSAVKEYVKRIRLALAAAFAEAGIQYDPQLVLVAEPTSGSEVIYRLLASVEWIHTG